MRASVDHKALFAVLYHLMCENRAVESRVRRLNNHRPFGFSFSCLTG
jgi:hypothetical protein